MFLRKLPTQKRIIQLNCQILKRFASNPGTATYEGDGKTSVHVLNKELENGLLVNAISQAGFRYVYDFS